MKNKIFLFTTILFVTFGFLSACEKKSSHKEEPNVYYTCSMHSEIKKDAPGKCPKCGMDLIKKEAEHHNHSDSEHKH